MGKVLGVKTSVTSIGSVNEGSVGSIIYLSGQSSLYSGEATSRTDDLGSLENRFTGKTHFSFYYGNKKFFKKFFFKKN
jgi:hypothetical protein